jgi:DNA-binding NtrC family response regulator
MTPEKHRSPLVLIVDDEGLIRWALSEGLRDHGYRVEQAATGADALAQIARAGAEPLVIVLDLRLPDVSDLSLLRTIRAQRPDTPVVMMTAHGSADDQAEAERLGVFRFVGKPFDMGDMIRIVREAWSAGHGQRP